MAHPSGLRVGMVVYDRSYEMVAVVDYFNGPFVHLSRPTGLIWQSRWVSVRVGTEYEQRQLTAIGKLYRLRLKGMVLDQRQEDF
ncbi:hypothetical protein QR77_07230 [Streptomyces sp. 150FB]|nr:hypothetical protein QR77_07230 [Streptomyces sp. 150FB]